MEIHSLSNHPPTLMESQVRIYSPQHISGASWQNIVSAFSETKWRRWRLVLKCLKTTNKKHKMAPFISDSEIKVSGSSEVTKRFKKILHYYLIYLFIYYNWTRLIMSIKVHCSNHSKRLSVWFSLLKQPGLKLFNELRVFLCMATHRINEWANLPTNKMIQCPERGCERATQWSQAHKCSVFNTDIFCPLTFFVFHFEKGATKMCVSKILIIFLLWHPQQTN